MIERGRLARALAVWMRFAAVMAAVNSFILMLVFYALVFAPLGIGKRLLGEDFFGEAPDGESGWRPRAGRPTEDYKRLF